MKIALPSKLLHFFLLVGACAILFIISFTLLGRWIAMPKCFGSGPDASSRYCTAFRKGSLDGGLSVLNSKWPLPLEISDSLSVEKWYVDQEVFVFEYVSTKISITEQIRIEVLKNVHEWICITKSGAKFITVTQQIPNRQIVTFRDGARFKASYSRAICNKPFEPVWIQFYDESK